MSSAPSGRRRTGVLVLLAASVAFPLGVLASHQYADVPDSNPFHGDITAITNAGVTSGCGGGNYCPDRNVTRAEMAAFMNRLGALAANKTPVVNADRVDGYHANGLNRFAYANHWSNGDTDPLIDGSSVTNGHLVTTITTPGRGYLQIMGQGELYNASPSNDNIPCWLEVDDSIVPGSQVDQDTDFDAVANADQQVCATMGGAIVCAAATYTVEIVFADVGSSSEVQDASLMVEYIPFNGSGGTPSFIDCPIIILPASGSADR